MINNENIICFSTIDWDFIWQSQQEIMSTLAKNGNRVLFIDNTGLRVPSVKDLGRLKNRILNWRRGISGIRKEFANFYVYSPIIFPFPYSIFFKFINRGIVLSIIKRWMHLMNFSNPIIWVYLPTGLVVDLTRELDAKLVIYYSVDEYGQTSTHAKRIKKSENIIIKESDIIFTTSLVRLHAYLKFNKNTYFFPDGLSKTLLEATEKPSIIPMELREIRHPIIGYVGGIHKWLDQDLIFNLAQERQDLSIIIIGPIQCDISRLSSLKNIHFISKKDHDALANYIKIFDVCLIPYKITDYTNTSYPSKAIEYMAFGKPVVSTALKEFKSLFSKEVYFADNNAEFIALVETAIRERDNRLKLMRMQCAKDNSWEKRTEEMSRVIQEAINKKIIQKEIFWKEIFYSFQKKVKQKLITGLVAILILYLAIFYTPFIWFAAEPLRLSSPLCKVDAIVIFAGGAGESGKVGQGYEERVQYAVELYKEGYASKLIFSSGYMYAFKEPLVMKALAVSLGIPEEAIIIEDKAHSTYENVKFSKQIINKHGWDKILLVSSPYHMRRVSLVFRKIAKEIKVSYASIPKSLFYAHEDRNIYGRRVWHRVNIQQIEAIIHEYLGILYYWWKGYI